MRPALLKHYFHYGVQSALHITDLEIGEIYDSIHMNEDGQWVKSRWERTKMKGPKRVINEDTGKEEIIWVWIPAFHFKARRNLNPDEVSEIMDCLEAIDNKISDILNEFYEDIYEPSMLFESAWRNHTLAENNQSITEFKNNLYSTIGDQFDLDAKSRMFRIICAEIWHSNEEQ